MDLILALAANPALSPEHVDRLAASGDPQVLQRLSSRRNLSAAHVETLIASGDREVFLSLIQHQTLALDRVPLDDPQAVLAAAGRPDVPGGWIDMLASCPDVTVRREFARRHNERLDFAEALGEDDDCEVLSYVSGVWDMPDVLARQLYRRQEACVRVALARSGFTPPEILAELAVDGGQPELVACPGWPDVAAALLEIRRGTASNTNTPIEATEQFWIDLDRDMAVSLAYRHDLSIGRCRELVAFGDREVSFRVLSNWSVPADFLRQLYEADDGFWRGAIRANPRMPLDLHVRDSHADVYTSVCFHPDVDGLLVLAADPDPRVRLIAATSYRIPDETRQQLIADPDLTVTLRAAAYRIVSPEQIRQVIQRWGVAAYPLMVSHPQSPPDVLQAIAADPSTPPDVLMDVAWNENASPAALRTCLIREPACAALMAENPSAPPDLLLKFARHSDPEVLQAAARNPSLPMQAIGTLLGRANLGLDVHRSEP